MNQSNTRAHAEYRFQDGGYAVHLMIDGGIAQPSDVTLNSDVRGQYTEPWLILPAEAMHQLYDAIGRALGKHTCNEEVLREALKVERERTTQLLSAVVAKGDT